MNEDLHKMDDLFKKAINDYEEESPSEQVWENIDKNLDKKKVVFISEKYNKLKWVAAALLIFSAGMAMYTWNTKLKNKELVRLNNTNTKRKAASSVNKIAEDKKEKNETIADKAIKEEKSNAATAINGNKNAAENKKNSVEKEAGSEKEKAERLVKNTENPGTVVKNTRSKNEEQPAVNQFNGKEKSVAGNLTQKDNLIVIDKEALKPKKTANIVDLPDLLEEKPNIKTELYIAKDEKLNILLSDSLLQNNLKTQAYKNPITTESKAVASAKTIKSISAKQSKLSTTVFFSPDFVSTRLDNDHSNFREEDRHEIEKDEKKNISSTFGVLLNYKTGKNWIVSAGITYSSIVTDITPKILYARPDGSGNINYRFNCSAGYSYITVQSRIAPPAGDTITALSSKNTLQYIGVPVGANYTIDKGRFVFTPGMAITANFLTKGNIETVIAGASPDANKTINHIDGLKSNYFSGALSFGANYNVNNSIALTFIPVARFALSSINKDAQVKTYLNSIGLVAGLTFRL